jgi:hypothetical protein
VSTAEPLPQRPGQNPLVERPIKPTSRQGCVQNMLFPIGNFHLILERGWLPDVYDSYRLNYELVTIISLDARPHQRTMQMPIAGMILLRRGIQTVETEREVCACWAKPYNPLQIHANISSISLDLWIGEIAKPKVLFPRNIVPSGISYPRYHRRSVPKYGDKGLQDP